MKKQWTLSPEFEGSIPSFPTTLRVGEVVSRWAHNSEVKGANPLLATNSEVV